jgi:hypothetical protein
MKKSRFNVRLPRRGEERSGGPPLMALLLHIAVVILVVRAVSVPVLDFLTRVGERPVQENITYLDPDVPDEIAVVPPPRVVDRRASEPVPAVARPALPVMPTLPAVADTGRGGAVAGPPIDVGTGRQVFGSGVSGLTTGAVDPRLVAPPGIPNEVVRAPKPNPNAVVNAWVGSYWDSVATAQAAARERRAPGDWTVGKDGRKYGVDQQYIYFGKYKLPTVLLALLPINAQANPSMVERNRALQSMRWEIDFHAQRAANEAEFRRAVDELRVRRERERKAQQDQQGTSPLPSGRVPPEHP